MTFINNSQYKIKVNTRNFDNYINKSVIVLIKYKIKIGMTLILISDVNKIN